MTSVNIFEAKTHLSKLLEKIESGDEQEIIIARNGKPVARLLPIQGQAIKNRLGVARGKFIVPENLDGDNEQIAQLFMKS